MKRPLLISILISVVGWFFQGINVSYRVINEKIFDTISPPTSLFNGNFLNFCLRLLDPVTYYSGDSMVINILLIPAIIFVFLIIYYIKKRNDIGKVKSLLYFILSIFIVIILNIIFLVTIPVSVEWLTMRMKAGFDTKKAINLLSQKKIITNSEDIFKYIYDNKRLKVFSDYGNAGSVLAVLIENKEKFSFYESFYLPLYLSKNKDLDISEEVNNLNMYMFDDNLIINKINDKDTLEKLILPIANNLLKNSYYKNTSLKDNKLKEFEVIPSEEYQDFYIKKLKSNLEESLIINQEHYAENNKTINSYESLKDEEDKQYKMYVIEQGIKYEEGCIKVKKYNDCEEFIKVIEENKKTIEKNRQSIEENHNRAIVNNRNINKAIVDIRREMEDFSNVESDNAINNKSKYSVGVAFGNDTIYIKYYEKDPINSAVLATVIHELLHIYSYNEYRDLPEPINEGITEFLTYKAMGQSEIDTIRSAGYNIEVQIVLALLEKIKKEDLIKVYFAGKDKDFKDLMKTTFPNVDYSIFSNKMDNIFNKTYQVDGLFRSFDKALIDHEEVVEIRRLLGLPDKKFEFEF